MTLDERITRYIAKCPPAVSGSDGHGTTFKVAVALVHGFALDADVALRWMLIYNDGCMPPWKPRELRHKVAQAEKVAHQKPRGHLLGNELYGQRRVGQSVVRVVPVALTPRKSRFRTVRTVFSEPCVNAREGVEPGNDIYGASKQPSEPSAIGNTTEAAKEPELAVDWPSLVTVPDCKVGRPPEIKMADEDWQKINSSGFASEPLVQMAAWMFGPGCTVIEAGRVRP